MPGAEKEQEIASAGVEDRQVYYHGDELESQRRRFIVDTPPPTVSGSLHLGHACFIHAHRPHGSLSAHVQVTRSCIAWVGTTTDCPPTAEFRTFSMCAVMPPCPMTPDLKLERGASGASRGGGYRVGITLLFCDELVVDDEKKFKELWLRLGVVAGLVRHINATIDERCRRIAQWSFLDLARQGPGLIPAKP